MAGILADKDIAALLQNGQLLSPTCLDDDQIQPASLDLRLGHKAYRVRASFLPGPDCGVADKIARYTLHEFDITKGAVFETGCVYIVPLLESLALAPALSASANPKSSTGRLDVFTRVITDNAQEFDKIAPGYHGQLYLEISPRTFPILARMGSRLSQIRFRSGYSQLDKEALCALQQDQKIISSDRANIRDNGIGVSIDLVGDEAGLIGYRGKHHSAIIDVDQKASAPILEFWEPIYNHGQHEIILDPNQFYILVSQEEVCVPPLYAAEMTPYDPLVGEFRVHYAGFFDPGFGWGPTAAGKSRAVLEVRSHEVPFILQHGQIIGRLVYEHMLSRPHKLYGEKKGSNYQAQKLKLSKHFY